eukprot:m.168992 g.168992  ORF g.168992 m.168992 type:complete len:492 (+) comp18223_c0_seq2:274-1749(+)
MSARARAIGRLESPRLSSAPRPKTLDSVHGVRVVRNADIRGLSLDNAHQRPKTAAEIMMLMDQQDDTSERDFFDESDAIKSTGDWTVLLKHCGIHTKVSMENRGITHVPGLIGAFKRLRHLSLRSNNLSCLPAAFAELQQLKTLNLGDNAFEELPVVLQELGGTLQTLHFFNNNLSGTLDGNVLGALRELKILNVNRNRITSFPDNLCSLRKLETLSAQRNALSTLPEEVGDLCSLQSLDLTDNDVHNIPNSVLQLTRLTKCCLVDNKLRAFPKCLSRHKSLCELDLSINLIESFDADGVAFARRKHRTLHFDDNPFLQPLQAAQASRISHGLPTLQELCLRTLYTELPSKGLAAWEREPMLRYAGGRQALPQLAADVRTKGQNCPVCTGPLVCMYLAVVKYETVGRSKVPVQARLCSYRCLLKQRHIYFATERTLREGQYASTACTDGDRQIPQGGADVSALSEDVHKLQGLSTDAMVERPSLPAHWRTA